MKVDEINILSSLVGKYIVKCEKHFTGYDSSHIPQEIRDEEVVTKLGLQMKHNY